MDPLEAVFLFCFVFGLAMSAVSFALGSLHLGGGHDGVGHDTAGHGSSGHHLVDHDVDGRSGPSVFNVNTGTAFLAFFGGIGYLLYSSFGLAAGIALVVAVVAGLAGGGLIFLLLVRVLYRTQRFMDPADFVKEGSIARVSMPIRSDGIGEIIFSKNGTRRGEGARSARGIDIPVGAEVVIVKYEGGLAYVEPWASYAGQA